MKKILLYTFIIFVMLSGTSFAKTYYVDVNSNGEKEIKKVNVEVKGGNFLFENKTLLYFPKNVSSDVVSVAERFAATLDVATGLELEISSYKSFEKANKRKKAKNSRC